MTDVIPVANTLLGEEEAKAAYEAVKSGWISFLGPKVKEFEDEFAKKVGARYAIAINSGTAALHVALAALDIKERDEVILPSLTFISTANAVLYQNAIPVLAECDPRTYNITADEIEKRITKKTKAIIPVDMNGMPVDYDSILKVSEKYSIPVIADSAESLGATYKERKLGSVAGIHIFSFFPNKNISTGEGGMITTNNHDLEKKMRIILNQGQDRRYNHIMLGYNYRMTNIQAAVGVEQLKKLDFILEEKEKIARRYIAAFRNCKNIKTPYVPDYVTQHAWYMFTISVENVDRDEIVRKLEEEKIQTRLSFPPVHIQPFYKEKFNYKESDLPISYNAWRKLINIPIWAGMNKKQDYVIDKLIEICEG